MDKQYYTQFVNSDGDTITSAQVGPETKFFVTIVDPKADVSTIQSEVESKLKELAVKFEWKSEYTTSKGHRGIFYVAPDLF